MSTDQQRYRVIDRLAAGGMAEVYVGESAGLEGFKKLVAIKRVLPHLSQKKRFIAMFLDEARLAAHLSHSNIVQVFDVGVGDNTYFIVMEYVEGADLKSVMKSLRDSRRVFPIEAAVFIAVKICEGLAYAHEQTSADGEPLNAVHRDVSPPNVLISKHGEVKIVDFGLAKASTQLEKSEAGIIKGKFSYLSPEAAHGNEVDARADIFAIGIILWEMLAGRRLFQGKTDYDTVKIVQGAEVPPISELHPDADAQLESILKRALARETSQRYASARALGQDLTRFLYRLARPVSAFDIAELVRGPMASRQRKSDRSVSIIDKLIQETLFEFTSLQDKSSSVSGSEVGGLELATFEAFGRWADEADISERQSSALLRDSLPAGVLEEGNLAVLEGPEPSSGLLSDDEDGPESEDFGDSVSPSSSEPLAVESAPSQAEPTSQTAEATLPIAPVSHAGGSGSTSDNLAIKLLLLLIIAASSAVAVLYSGLV